MKPTGATWSLDRFAGGLDLREGLYAQNQSRFRRLLNVFIDHGGKIRRRPPCTKIAGAIDTASKGLVGINGQLYVIAPKGTTVTHGGAVAAKLKTLFFDVPDLCTGGWELLGTQVFDGYLTALIAHDYPSVAYPKLVYLHVWDGLLFAPTFVQDPEFPGSFTPSMGDLTGQRYDAAFRPVIAQGVTKLWTSTLSGNAQASRTADPRVWNELTKDSLLQDGESWSFVVPEGLDVVRSFVVARDASWLGADGRWAYYVLERATPEGGWLPMTEVATAPTAAFTWRPVSIPSRFAGGWNEIRVDVCWGQAAAGLVRLRLVAGGTSVQVQTTPTVAYATGSGSTWDISVGASAFTWRGGDQQTTVAFTRNFPATAATWLYGVAGDGFPVFVDITAGFPNGWQSEHHRWLKKLVFAAAVVGSTALNTPAWDTHPAIVGTAAVTAASPNVVGTGTSFLTALAIGDVITINGEDHTVLTITDNTHLAVSTNFAGNASGAPITVLRKHYAQYDGVDTSVATNLTTGVAIGDNLRINGTDWKVKAVTGGGIYVITSAAGASGDYTSSVDALFTATQNPVPHITDYLYAFQNAATSEWYGERILEYVDQAGAQDAVTISTSSHDNTGGRVSAIATVGKRMLVCYPGAAQLWSVDQASAATEFLDLYSFGTGDQDHAQPVPFYGTVIIPTPTGWRSVNVQGANRDTIQDTNIGEPIQPLAMPSVRSAYFWPWYGQFIVAGTDVDGSTRFMVLDYSVESKISAWSQWSVAGLPAEIEPGSFVIDQHLLYFRSGSFLLAFDASATRFADFADPEGTPYLSDLLWHFNDFGRPGTNKRLTAFDIVQDGSSLLSLQVPPYGARGTAAGVEIGDVPVSGITYGFARRGIGLVAPAVAPRLQSRDIGGWQLQRLAIDYLNLRR